MIRLASGDDATDVAAIYAPIVDQTHFSFETTSPPDEDVRRRIRETVTELPWLVCEHEERVLGYAYANPYSKRAAYQWTVGVSVYVDDRWRRRGIARGLYESLFELLRVQGLHTAVAVIALPNEPSVSLHESFGFERVGVYRRIGYKHGAWQDVGHWQCSIQADAEGQSPPAPPTPIEALRDTDHFEEALATGTASITLS